MRASTDKARPPPAPRAERPSLSSRPPGNKKEHDTPRMPDRVFNSALISSDSANNLSDAAERLFVRVVVSAGTDNWGRREASPRRLRADCIPLLEWEDQQITAALEELVREGMVELYIVDGRFYLSVCNWDAYQRTAVRLRRGKSRYPSPEDADDRRTTAERPPNDRRSPPLISSSSRDISSTAVVSDQSEAAEDREMEDDYIEKRGLGFAIAKIPGATDRTPVAVATVMRKYRLPESVLYDVIQRAKEKQLYNPAGWIVRALENEGKKHSGQTA